MMSAGKWEDNDFGRLYVGYELEGYCNGYFGRDFYGGVIEGQGKDWLVARDDQGYPHLAWFEGGLDHNLIKEWLEE